ARHAPGTLARDGPVGPVRNHVEDALRAPRRDPTNATADGIERALPQAVLVERDEPLLGGAKQRRVLAAPTVRIRVRQRLLGDERADLPQMADDLWVCLPHGEAREELDFGREAT